jgi:hypothetical protein
MRNRGIRTRSHVSTRDNPGFLQNSTCGIDICEKLEHLSLSPLPSPLIVAPFSLSPNFSLSRGLGHNNTHQ